MKKLFFYLLIAFAFGQFNFNMEDLNPNSEFYNQNLGPSDFPNEIRIVYFGYFY